MQAAAIKTHRIEGQGSLTGILDNYILSLKEKDIIVITSKIVSICQGRVIKKGEISKETLIKKEADAFLDLETPYTPYGIYLTLKNNILIPSAGIDESNTEDSYVLYPEDVQGVCIEVWKYLCHKHEIQNLGILICDSHTTPLRRGVTGIALGWCGFEPFYCYKGKPDLYNQPLRFTEINLLDALATTAALVMGEGEEQTPLALISQAPKISFLDRIPSAQEIEKVHFKIEEDLYAPLLLSVQWLSQGK